MSQIDWDNALSDSTLAICVNNFYQKLHIIINDNVLPCHTKLFSYPPWYNSELKSLVKQKQAAHASAGSDEYPAGYIQFKKLRAQVIRCSRLKYRKYLNSIE